MQPDLFGSPSHLDFLPASSDIESQRMACVYVVKLCMIPFPRASAVEAMKANIQPSRIILVVVVRNRALQQPKSLTIESKHCVQSSLYTGWVELGGRRS
jgi:hypothetical protein